MWHLFKPIAGGRGGGEGSLWVLRFPSFLSLINDHSQCKKAKNICGFDLGDAWCNG